MDEKTFRDRHGVEIFYRRWPTRDSDAVVVIAHGASEHSARYDRFAHALGDARFAVYALDHRGHGHTSSSTGAGRTGAGGGEALIEDLDEVVDLALSDKPAVPVLLFGHSMGSMLALAYATRTAERLRALVLSGFAAPMGALEATRQMFQSAIDAGMADEPMAALGGMGGSEGRTPYDWLSRDDAEVDRYIADPMCGDDHPLTYGFVHELNLVVGPALEPPALARISCPVLLITGDQDPAAAMGENPRLLEAAMREVGVTVTSRLYAGARHELLNETNRDEVTADLIDWLRQRVTE